VEGITLFIFGGMARTRMDAASPEDELAIAGVGPLMSLALGLLFLALGWICGRLGLGPAVATVAAYLGVINLALAGFNILPGFPLDGGRLFRALAWKHTGDVTRATRWASTGGRWLGYGLIATGLLEAFAGAVVGGIWLVFIGWFLRGAAEMSFRQHLLHLVLEGVTARQVMSEHPEVVDPSLSLQELVDDHFLRRRYQSFPVVLDGRLEGLVTLAQVKQVPRDRWHLTPVAVVMAPASEDILVAPWQPMTEVVAKLRPAGVGRVLVAEDHRLLGIISASDVAAWASRSQELSGAAR